MAGRLMEPVRKLPADLEGFSNLNEDCGSLRPDPESSPM